MTNIRVGPGPAAAHAFRLGMIAGGFLGLCAIGLAYWLGSLTPVVVGYVLFMLFPVYLVLVAAVLSVWLGYDQDSTSLRPVYRQSE
jgi:hypothetical protein